MKFSRNWVQTFFDNQLSSPDVIAEKLTFHSSEVEEVVTLGDDTVFDVKVLPDKSAWLLSHRGLARELSVIFDIPMKFDPLTGDFDENEVLQDIKIVLDTPTCDFYGVAIIEGITVGPSPDWLKARLETIGQRSINNIVDATNYVMFELGQPLHAFDADTFKKDAIGNRKITVRSATDGEQLVTLSNEKLSLTTNDAVITDGISGQVLALAGIKGGLQSGVTSNTKTIVLEAAHFDRVATRLGSQRHKLPTDAAKRYENGLSRSVTPFGLRAGAKLIAEIAGGKILGLTQTGDSSVVRPPVTISVAQINRVLGICIKNEDVRNIFNRFGYEVVQTGDDFTVTPPHERDDITMKQDVIEEIGRMYGLAHIVSIMPKEAIVQELNKRHYYADKIRATLIDLGFSEIYTSSFRASDVVQVKNALASDKSYLRSSLHDNIREAVIKNVPHRDLLGLSAIKLFEIGTAFSVESESFHVALGVQSGTSYKAKVDDALLKEAQDALSKMLEVSINWVGTDSGTSEFSLDALLPDLSQVAVYESVEKTVDSIYKPFSLYPSVTRDIALWVPVITATETIEALLRTSAGALCVRIALFDTFIKDDKTSLAFRLVFQSKEKTLTASEVDDQMKVVHDACVKAGFEVR